MKVNTLREGCFALICGTSIIFYIKAVIFTDDDAVHLGAEK